MERPNDYLSEVDLLIQLAEEASELAQAAAKMARQKRGTNPACRSDAELEAALEEELSDVLVVACELPYRPQWDIMDRKRGRWMERLRNIQKVNERPKDGMEHGQ